MSGSGGMTPTTGVTVPTNQQMLDAIKAQIYGNLAAGGIQDYRIAGRQISYYNIAELLQLEQRYTALVDRENSDGIFVRARFNKKVSS